MQITTQSTSRGVAQNSKIGIERLLQSFFGNLTLFTQFNFFIQLPDHSLLGSFTQGTVVRKRNIAEKINTTLVFTCCDFTWMQLKHQLIAQKTLYFWNHIFQKILIVRNNHKIVGVADIVFYFQLTLHKLIKLIHVDIGKQLRCQITNRESFPCKQIRRLSCKALNYFLHKPQRVRIFNFPSQEFNQNSVIDAIKKLSYITFKRVRGPNVVSRYFPKHFIQDLNTLMSSFSNTAGKGVGYKSWFKNRIENFKDCVVQYSISNRSLVDVSKLWVVNVKITIRPMLVGLA